MTMGEDEQRSLAQIERDLGSGLAKKFRGGDRRLARNCPENVAFRENLKIAILATAAGLLVIGLALALFLLYTHFHPIHTPDMPYGHLGG